MAPEKIGSPLERRVHELERDILKCVADFWPFSLRDKSALPPGTPESWDDPAHPAQAAFRESLQRLLKRWPPEELSSRSADMHFHEGLWCPKYNEGNWKDWDRKDTIEWIVNRILKVYPPPDLPERLAEDLSRVLDNETQNARLEEARGLPDTPAALDLARRVIRGEFRLSENADFGGRELERLYRHGEFTYQTFCDLMRRVPGLLRYADEGFFVRPKWDPPYDSGFMATCRGYVARFADELIPRIAPSDEETLKVLVSFGRFHGPQRLIAAARLHRDNSLGIVEYESLTYKPEIRHVLLDIVSATDVEPASPEERGRMVEELRGFGNESLRRLLPIAEHGRGILLEALGWQRALPLVREIERTGAALEDRSKIVGLSGSPDTTLGVLDLPSVRAALDAAGPDLAQEVIGLFRDAKRFADNALLLVAAVPGWNRKEVMKRAQRRNQPSVKAYGLLPIERGEDEVQERYLFLKQFAKESKKFGPQRQVNERAASQVAMANLAQVAGYADAVRLEWAMEARIGGEGRPAERSWVVGEYAMSIEGTGADAAIAVSKGGKRLASVPPAVRKDPAYAEAKEAVTAMRGQVSRFRTTFEDMMVNEDAISREDIARLLRLPVARDLLAGLVLSDPEDGQGLLAPEGDGMVALDGTRVPIPASVTIAHPHRLLAAGVLAAWQQELVRRRVVQPFKQVFREVYVVTPAEQGTRTFSNRFAGRLVNPRIAQKLFQTRGWQVELGDVALPYKLFPKSRLRAELDIPDAGHYLGEGTVATTDQVYFLRHPAPPGEPETFEARKVPLEEVPPIVFSEVMRDADLVVSVAPGTDEEGRRVDLSEEAYARRGEIVTAILSDLGMPNVSIDGRFARVKGKLAAYRIHMGSANVYLEPANHICIFPDRYRKPPPKLFLPFALDDDPKIAEVVSKVVLLANDDRIKDPDILNQIREGGHPADTGEL